MHHVASLVLVCAMAACTFEPAGSLPEPDATSTPGPPVTAPDATPQQMPDARPVDALPPVEAFCDPASLVACFRFEDGIQDESGAGLVITAANVSFAEGRLGRGLVTTDQSVVRLDETPALDVTALTLEMWVYPDAIPAAGRAGLFDNDGQYGMFVHPGGTVHCTGNGAPVLLGNAVAAGAWTHLACTNDGQAAILYVDGVARASGVTGPLNQGTSNGSAIGGDAPPGDPFLGRIDDLRIWNRVRTAAEICATAGCTSQ